MALVSWVAAVDAELDAALADDAAAVWLFWAAVADVAAALALLAAAVALVLALVASVEAVVVELAALDALLAAAVALSLLYVAHDLEDCVFPVVLDVSSALSGEVVASAQFFAVAD